MEAGCVIVRRSELNLGVQPAGFTVVKSYRPTDDHKDYLRVCISTFILCSPNYLMVFPAVLSYFIFLRCVTSDFVIFNTSVIINCLCYYF